MTKLEKLFNAYIPISKKWMKAKRLLDAEIIKVYGFHYSDKDLDYIIDALDYVVGDITFKEFDMIMKRTKETK